MRKKKRKNYEKAGKKREKRKSRTNEGRGIFDAL